MLHYYLNYFFLFFTDTNKLSNSKINTTTSFKFNTKIIFLIIKFILFYVISNDIKSIVKIRPNYSMRKQIKNIKNSFKLNYLRN